MGINIKKIVATRFHHLNTTQVDFTLWCPMLWNRNREAQRHERLQKLITCFLFIVSAIIFNTYGNISAKICLSQQDIIDICGTSRVKLVFMNKDTLYLVDFSQPVPEITPLPQIRNAICPVISPDGSKVTYPVSTNDLEYNSSGSAAWICDLSDSGMPVKVADPGYIPRFVKSTSGISVIYSTCGKKASGKNHIWDSCGGTFKRSVNGTSIGAAQQVWEHGSYNGGISWDNRYISTAESSPGAYIIDITGSAIRPDTLHKFKVTKTSSGADTLIVGQTCNLSSSSSRLFTNTVLYLDFSSSVFTDAGCSTPDGLGTWGVHSRIFLTKSDGRVLRYYDVPHDGVVAAGDGAGEITEKEWGYPEWSSHPYFAVSTVQVTRLWYYASSYNDTYMNEQIFLIDLKDSVCHKIVESTDTSMSSSVNMQWPWIWIDTAVDFREDSVWLSTDSQIRKYSSQEQVSGRLVSFVGNAILCKKPVKFVCVYSIKGELLEKIVPDQTSCIKISLNMTKKIRKNSVFCARIQTVDGDVAEFKFYNR
jgi:hypothetical protein